METRQKEILRNQERLLERQDRHISFHYDVGTQQYDMLQYLHCHPPSENHGYFSMPYTWPPGDYGDLATSPLYHPSSSGDRQAGDGGTNLVDDEDEDYDDADDDDADDDHPSSG